MRLRLRHLGHLAAALAALVGSAAPARATILREVPLDEMIVDAEAIVIGQVAQVGTQIQMRHGQAWPWTVNTVRVESWLKGSGGPTVALSERGGRFGDRIMAVAGTPQYRVGEAVVVFLWRDPEGRLRTYGMAMGKYRIEADPSGPIVSRELDAVAFARFDDTGMQVDHAHDRPMPLALLLQRIDQVLAARAATSSSPEADGTGANEAPR